MESLDKNPNTLRNIFLILLAFLFMGILYITHLMAGFLVPIFIAFFTAMFLHPFIHRLHQTRVPNWLSTVIVYVVFILIIAVFLTIIAISFTNFVTDLPDITRDFRNKIEELIIRVSQMEIVKSFLRDDNFQEQMITMLIDMTTTVVSIENLQNYIIKPVGLTLNILKGFGLYALSLIFIIPGMGRISQKVFKAFPDGNGTKINNIINNIMDSMQSYMVAKSIISFILGLLSFIICVSFRVKYALLWGVVIFLFNYIPYIGSFIAVIFPLILSIVQFQSSIHFAFLAALLIGVQVVMGNVVEPNFMSRGVNLSPLVIFTSLLIWGYIWGIVGVILSVPITSAMNIVCENIEALHPVSVILSAKRKRENGVLIKNIFKKIIVLFNAIIIFLKNIIEKIVVGLKEKIKNRKKNKK